MSHKSYEYKTIKADSPEDLAKKVDYEHFNDDWEPVGSPFTAPYVSGHGYVHAAPEERQQWIHVEFYMLVRKAF